MTEFEKLGIRVLESAGLRMNKLDRHGARCSQAIHIRAAELRAAKARYDEACAAADNKYNMTIDTSRKQMENEPNG